MRCVYVWILLAAEILSEESPTAAGLKNLSHGLRRDRSLRSSFPSCDLLPPQPFSVKLVIRTDLQSPL